MPPAAPPRTSGPRHRARCLRRLAVTWTVVAFAAVWGVIYAQMRAGDDPVLGAGTNTTPAVTAGTSTTADTSAIATDDSGLSDEGASYDDASSYSESSGSGTSAMTTSQS